MPDQYTVLQERIAALEAVLRALVDGEVKEPVRRVWGRARGPRGADCLCLYCHAWLVPPIQDDDSRITHAPDCPWRLARALLKGQGA